MGYTTDFAGHVTVTPPLNPDEVAWLRAFADADQGWRPSGPYRTDGDGGPDDDSDPRRESGKPDGYLKWEPTDDGAAIAWSGAEKFRDADAWMGYLISVFLKPGALVKHELAAPVPGRFYPAEFELFTFDHVVNGTIDAQGEDDDDHWVLVVTDNVVVKRMFPTAKERVESDPELRAAIEKLKAEGITVEQYADLTGQDY